MKPTESRKIQHILPENQKGTPSTTPLLITDQEEGDQRPYSDLTLYNAHVLLVIQSLLPDFLDTIGTLVDSPRKGSVMQITGVCAVY